MILWQTNRPTVPLVVVLSLGISLSQVIREYAFTGLVAAGIFLIAASFLARRKKRLSLSLALGLAAVALGGLLIALAQRDGLSPYDVRLRIARGLFKLGQPVYFEGCVAEDSRKQGEEIITTIKLRAFLAKDHWLACKGKGIMRIANPKTETFLPESTHLIQGDAIRGWAVWRLPRNYANPGSAERKESLARKGIYVIGRVKSHRLLESIPQACSNAWTRAAVSVRNQVRKALEPIGIKEQRQPAAVRASLLIGDYSQLSSSTREVFQNSGTLHVLVVSGLHVAWIAGLSLSLLKLIRLPEKIRYLVAATVILFYNLVVGFQASITRCLWMFILYLIGRILLCRADPLNIIFASAFLLLVAQPSWLFETGFQLSFLCVTAITMTALPLIENRIRPLLEPLRNAGKGERLFLQFSPWHRRGRKLRVRCEILIEEATDRFPPPISSLLYRTARTLAWAALTIGSLAAVSLSIQLWIAPLMAYNFNRLSWIAPVANLVVVPLSSLVLGTGIFTVAASSLNLFGPELIKLAGELSSLLLQTAAVFTVIPGAWQRCVTPPALWVLVAIMLLLAWSYLKWRMFVPFCYTLILLFFVSHGSIPFLNDWFSKSRSVFHNSNRAIWAKDVSLLSFTFLDVGQGDSIFVRFPNKRMWLVDTGGLLQSQLGEDETHAFDLGELVVSRFLWYTWISKLDRLVLSHADLDHAGGAQSVLKNFKIGGLVHSFTSEDKLSIAIFNTARSKNVPLIRFFAGDQERIGSVLVRAIHPSPSPGTGTANENSLVLQFFYNHFSALLTGDLDKTGEQEILSRISDPRGLLLKVAHHGSRSGTSNSFLDAVRPRWAVISAGKNNPYGHPSSEVLHRLRRHGTKLFLTQDQGAITFETDGNAYAIRTYVNGLAEQGRL